MNHWSRKTGALLTATLFIFYIHTGFAQQASDLIAPEFSHSASKADSPTALSQSTSTKAPLLSPAKEFMVVTAHPLATQAAYQVLESGGSAIDAMVTVQTVLGLVEPQSSGLGGGAFALYYDAAKKTLSSFDGRETAPLAAPSDLFMREDQAIGFFDAVLGGLSVGTPGTVKLLGELHARFGTQSWEKLLLPAIELATKGFEVSPRLAESVQRDAERLKAQAGARAYFFPDDRPLQTGQLLKNPAYAASLSYLAKQGAQAFYKPPMSTAIIDTVRQSSNPGTLSQADFDAYRVIQRKNYCFMFLGYEICTMGPPSSGGLALEQLLGILSFTDLAERNAEDPLAWQLIAEASRRVFADRAKYVADPDFFETPESLVSKTYLKKRSMEITPGKASQQVLPGEAEKSTESNQSASSTLLSGNSPEQTSTSHFVIVDAQGNILSMTSTIENAFGSRLWVNGFLLNNELTDFSFLPKDAQGWIANRVEPGKRPRSSMSPTLVFHQPAANKMKQPYLALGSPGGSRIINFVGHSLIHILLWGDSMQNAFDRPHIINRFGKMELELNTSASNYNKAFQTMGYETAEVDINSGLHGVMFTGNGLLGAADQRREGMAMGR